MKLYVDDIRSAPDEKWKIVRTVEAAINAIDVFDFEVISLDHDISHQVVIGKMSRPYPCDETFYPVAVFIKEKYKSRLMGKEVGAVITCLSIDCPERKGGECKEGIIPKIIIHTANPAGALRMEAVLKGFEIERKDSYPANRLETIL